MIKREEIEEIARVKAHELNGHIVDVTVVQLMKLLYPLIKMEE